MTAIKSGTATTIALLSTLFGASALGAQTRTAHPRGASVPPAGVQGHPTEIPGHRHVYVHSRWYGGMPYIYGLNLPRFVYCGPILVLPFGWGTAAVPQMLLPPQYDATPVVPRTEQYPAEPGATVDYSYSSSRPQQEARQGPQTPVAGNIGRIDVIPQLFPKREKPLFPIPGSKAGAEEPQKQTGTPAEGRTAYPANVDTSHVTPQAYMPDSTGVREQAYPRAGR